MSGIIVAAAIILSFLSLMSFTDFLRFHWDIGEAEEGDGAEEEDLQQEPFDNVDPQEQPQPPQQEEIGFDVQRDGEHARASTTDEKTEEDSQKLAMAEEATGAEAGFVPSDGFSYSGGRDDDSPAQPAASASRAEEVWEDADTRYGEREDQGHHKPESNEPQTSSQQDSSPSDQPLLAGAVEDHETANEAAHQPDEHVAENDPVPQINPIGNQMDDQMEEDQMDDQMDVELHVAVDELVGIRGPVTILLRNMLWLLAFNCAYLGLFAFIPFSIGSSVLSTLGSYVNSPVMVALNNYLVPETLVKVLKEISSTAQEEDHTLQLPDLFSMALGYLVMSLMIFTWRSIVSAVCRGTPMPLIGRIRLALDCTAAVVKVGILLFLKMLLLPLLLGVCLDASTLMVFGTSAKDRIRFTAQNLVGSLLLHWVLGITFMLFVTVSVLQLREVMHPDILASVIRPQDPHPDLLGSLLRESGGTHARRMVMSLAIYIMLLFLLVHLPTLVFQACAPPHILPVQLQFSYLLPQFQVPLELVMFHLSVLAFLERFKNKIGELQHAWLVRACRFLGLTHFLLPLTLTEDSGTGNSVGTPLARPPPGWDDLVGGAGRWAWANESRSDVELNLAPRKRPSHLVFRLMLLLLASWITVLCLTVFGTALPLSLGRRFFSLLHVPLRLSHDPLAFAVGMGIILAAKGAIARGIHWLLTPNALMTSMGTWARRLPPPPSTAAKAMILFVTLWLGVAPLMVGTLFEMTLVVAADSWEAEGLRCLALGQDWVLGLVLLHLWAYLSLSNVVNGLWIQRRDALNPWQQRIARVVLAWHSLVVDQSWDLVTMQTMVVDLAMPITWTIGKALIFPFSLAIPLAGACPLVLRFLPRSIGTSFFMVGAKVTHFRRALALCVASLLASKTIEPLSDFVQKLHDAIRDDQYLVGLQLLNHERNTGH